MIHCIGDSHCCIFSGKACYPAWDAPDKEDILPYFNTYRLGPCTAFQLHKKLDLIRFIIGKFVKPGDTVLMCFGEVDCRAHLIKQSQVQKRQLGYIVRQCAYMYMQTIRLLKQDRIPVAVWGPIASMAPDTNYEGGIWQGTCEERNQVTAQFNQVLKEQCKALHIPFGTIFDKMIDENNITNKKYLTDAIHLSLEGLPLIMSECKRMGLLNEDAQLS